MMSHKALCNCCIATGVRSPGPVRVNSTHSGQPAGATAARPAAEILQPIRVLRLSAKTGVSMCSDGKPRRRDLFDQLVCASEERGSDGEAKCLRGLQVHHQLELRRLLNWQVRRFGASRNAISILGSSSIHIGDVWPIRHEASDISPFTEGEHCYHAIAKR